MPVLDNSKKNKAQRPSKTAMKAEANKTPSANDALKQELLQEPQRSPERMGASYGKIKGSRSNVADEMYGQRSGVIQSIPVSTNWEAIEGVFASRTVDSKLWQSQREQGGVD